MKINLHLPAITAVVPKGETAVITAAAAAAVITGVTASAVLKDVYGIHIHIHRKKGEGAPVPNPEKDDLVDEDFVDQIKKNPDPAASV